MPPQEVCIIGMSGGVDSTCAAWLMHLSGLRCTGITLMMSEHEQSRQSIEDASRVARAIGIPHRVLDVRDAFETLVVQRFRSSYRRGITPSPCLVCNPLIKWRLLIESDPSSNPIIATGHYARLADNPDGQPAIHRGRHLDQSYFLSRLPVEYLRRTRFPLGEMRKVDVREMVRSAGLPMFDRPDSQENCFIAGGRYTEYLARRDADGLPPPGDIIDRQGRVRGRHKGLHHYTIGQRSGLGIAAPEPLYVIEIDTCSNCLVVGSKQDAHSRCFRVGDCTWSGLRPPNDTIEAFVQVRYRHKPARCRIEPLAEHAREVRVELLDESAVIAPGQGAAFYADDMLLGGGEILRQPGNAPSPESNHMGRVTN